MSWGAVDLGSAKVSVQTLAIDPAPGSTLYVGTDGGVFGTCVSARCTLDAGLADGRCVRQTVPASVIQKFDRAVSLVRQVPTLRPGRARKLLRQARIVLRRAAAATTRAARGTRRTISPDCAAALTAVTEQIVDGLGV